MIDAGHTVLVPPAAKAVDPSSADVDLTVLFKKQAYARALYNGNAAPKDIAVTTIEGTTLTYKNVPSGCKIFGIFVTLKNANTTATNMIAEA